VAYRARGELFRDFVEMFRKLRRWSEFLNETFRNQDFPVVTVPGDEEEELIFATRRFEVQEENVQRGRVQVPDQCRDTKAVGARSHQAARIESDVQRQGRRSEEFRGERPFSDMRRDSEGSTWCRRGQLPEGRDEGRCPSSRPGNEERRDIHRRGREPPSVRGRTLREPMRRESCAEEFGTSSDEEEHRSVVPRRRSTRTNVVASWKVHVNGSEDLLTFLEDLEELMDTHSVSEEEVLRGVGGLLSGNAKIWYKAMKTEIYSWEAFKKTIRKTFFPNDGDDVILDRLRKMRRHDEPYLIYEARMEEQFQRLEFPVEQKVKLKLLLDGLHLFYRSRICSADVQTVRELRRACERMEPDKAQVRKLEAERERADKEKEDRFRRKVFQVNEVETNIKESKKNKALERRQNAIRKKKARKIQWSRRLLFPERARDLPFPAGDVEPMDIFRLSASRNCSVSIVEDKMSSPRDAQVVLLLTLKDFGDSPLRIFLRELGLGAAWFLPFLPPR